jgi:hypothetical protein
MQVLLMIPEIRVLVTMTAYYRDPDAPSRLPTASDRLIYDAATGIVESVLTETCDDLDCDDTLIEYAAIAIAKIKHQLNAVALESLTILDRYGNVVVTVY